MSGGRRVSLGDVISQGSSVPREGKFGLDTRSFSELQGRCVGFYFPILFEENRLQIRIYV